MPPTTPQDNAKQGTDDAQLLQGLLADMVPSRQAQQRPASLRSVAQQQQLALRGLRLRNWVDRALYGAERVLVVSAIIAFSYWLVDGPIRDWVHAYQRDGIVWAGASAATPMPTPPLRLPEPIQPAASAADGPAQAAALPFTRPEDASEAPASAGATRDGFLAPQALLGEQQAAEDPRPVRFSMPTIGAEMDVREIFVVDGAWEVAEYAAGYHNGTAFPGTIGNSVLSGHAGLRGAVFQNLGRLKPGDDVVVETARWRYTYRVRTSMSVWPTQIEVMLPTPTATLTLITCTNWDTQRLVVVADLVDARPLS
jgi:sortase A